MSEPQTEAGRALLHAMRFHFPERVEEWRKEIVAIEAEAHEQGRRDMDETLRLHAESPEHSQPAAPPIDAERLRHIDSAFTVFLTMADQYHPDGGPAPSWLDFIRERHAEVRAILARQEAPHE